VFENCNSKKNRVFRKFFKLDELNSAVSRKIVDTGTGSVEEPGN